LVTPVKRRQTATMESFIVMVVQRN
jgi:hypothetical protein